MISDRLSTLGWLAVVAWLGFVVHTAHGELTDAAPVKGLFRTYHPPHEGALGLVLDPIDGLDLKAQLRDRYRPAAPLPAGSDWHAVAEALALQPKAAVGPGEGLRPRLVWVAETPWLLVSTWGRRPIAVVPQVGVVALKPGLIPPQARALELRAAREAPW